MDSNLFSFFESLVLIDKKEKKHETANRIATNEVTSSMMLDSVRLPICKEVITKRQNPNKLAEVLRMCCEVLLAMGINADVRL